MIRPNLNLLNAENAYHGAVDYEEIAAHGFDAEDIIDFSVNSNPFGPASMVVDALRLASISQYPDKVCGKLRRALSLQQSLEIDQVLVGNGTAELLWLIAFAFTGQGDKVAVLEPTFSEYARNAQLMGAEVCEWRLTTDNGFAIDEDAIEQWLVEQNPKVVHLCSPNNPTGYQVSNQTLRCWSQQLPQTLFVVDEAYAQFLPNYHSAMQMSIRNVLVLRSMTKDYSLAGVRLGYVAGPASIIRTLDQVKIPWSVNEFAQIAGVAAIQAQSEYELMWQDLHNESTSFKASLSKVGYRLIESPMHYFLMEVAEGRMFRERLLADGLLVRLCDSYDLPNYVRLSTQLPEQNQRLLDFLKAEKSLKT